MDIEDYNEYQSLFKDELIISVRKLLKRLEDQGDYELEDSKEHNNLVEYFNQFYLHKKLSKKEFNIKKMKANEN